MTLQEAINSGKLPNLNESIYKKLGKRLNINIVDLNYVLDDKKGDLDRLRFDYEVNLAFSEEKIKKSQEKVLANYDELINKYTKLSNEMSKKFSNKNGSREYYLKEEKNDLNKLIKEIKQAKKDYEKSINRISISSENLGLEERVFNIKDSVELDMINRQQDNLKKSLEKEYMNLDMLSTLGPSSKTDKRISKVKDRIKQLQAKQGVLQNKQQKIVNKGIEKYKNIKERELNKRVYKIDRIEKYQNEKIYLNEKQKVIDKEIKEQQKQIEAVDKKPGLFNKFKKVTYQAEQTVNKGKRKVYATRELALDALRKSEKIMVKFSDQIYKNITNSKWKSK